MSSKKTAKKATKKLSKEDMKKALQAENRRITRDNAAFDKMTAPEKRVQIARDVIAQLATGRLRATPGMWLTGSDGEDLFDDLDLQKNLELQTIIKKTKKCEGCALGGMFMCAVERANKLKVSDMQGVEEDDDNGELYISSGEVGGDDTFNYMKRFFSQKQLDMIETAFEVGDGASNAGYESQEFAEEVEEPGERMRLIMENIVCNKGLFVPSKRPIQTWKTPGYVG